MHACILLNGHWQLNNMKTKIKKKANDGEREANQQRKAPGAIRVHRQNRGAKRNKDAETGRGGKICSSKQAEGGSFLFQCFICMPDRQTIKTEGRSQRQQKKISIHPIGLKKCVSVCVCVCVGVWVWLLGVFGGEEEQRENEE